MPYKTSLSAYPVLEAEIARRQIKKKDIAEAINIAPRSLSIKLMGKSDFTLTEAFVIRERFFEDMTVEKLFDKCDDIAILNRKVNKSKHRCELISAAKEIFDTEFN